MDQFEQFETKRFVGRLLGRGDVTGLMDKIQVGGWGLCCNGLCLRLIAMLGCFDAALTCPVLSG
jgi:hypothetical protein